ncbi:MAG: ABC transporter ATP-binding protein, partial [Tepidiformaceae bacterium]
MTIDFDHLSYWYPSSPAGPPLAALDDVIATVAEASFTLLAGASAGGKSTLLRTINGLVPQFHGGRMTGAITVNGLDPSRTPARRMAGIAGMVFQEPESQAVAETVEDEIAFGMEQHGVAQAEMRRRIDVLLPELGIEPLRHRSLNTLSGGERQRVAIAAVLALEPRILLLDEPTSQIDPAGADAVIAALQRLHRARGLTIVVAEHRLERLLPIVDAVLEVEAGRATPMSPREAAARLRTVPPVCAIGRRLGWTPMPLTVGEAGQFPARLRDPAGANIASPTGVELLAVEGLTVCYGELVALHNASFAIRAGEVIALTGTNGSGKSTLFRAIAGLVQPAAGFVRFAGAAAPRAVQSRTAHAGLVPQDPAIALYHETVRAEVAETLRYRHSTARRPELGAA